MLAIETPNKTEGMNRVQIMEVILNLSHSQGLYSRIARHLINLRDNDPEAYDDAMRNLEAQNFKDSVDLILYLES